MTFTKSDTEGHKIKGILALAKRQWPIGATSMAKLKYRFGQGHSDHTVFYTNADTPSLIQYFLFYLNYQLLAYMLPYLAVRNG